MSAMCMYSQFNKIYVFFFFDMCDCACRRCVCEWFCVCMSLCVNQNSLDACIKLRQIEVRCWSCCTHFIDACVSANKMNKDNHRCAYVVHNCCIAFIHIHTPYFIEAFSLRSDHTKYIHTCAHSCTRLPTTMCVFAVEEAEEKKKTIFSIGMNVKISYYTNDD